MRLVFLSLLIVSINGLPPVISDDHPSTQFEIIGSKLSESLFILVKLQPQVKSLEREIEKNPSVDLQMDYVDLARKYVDSAEVTTGLALHFLYLNGLNYTKRPLSAQEVFNIPQKIILAELMVNMTKDNSQMIEVANDLVTHSNGVRCALIKRINEVVGKINKENPAYPRSMLEFHEMTKYRPMVHVEPSTKPLKSVKIRDECEQAKKKHLPKRLLKYFCGNFAR